MAVWGIIIICTIFSRPTALTDSDEEDEETKAATEDSAFVAPREISDIEDVFTRGDKEYVFVNFPVNHLQASAMCDVIYKGRLALVTTAQLAEFLAEALSETNLLMDALWIGAKFTNKKWCWYERGHLVEPVNAEILQLFVDYSESVNASDRTCLSMGRKDHDVPHFPALTCDAQRAMMCERDAKVSGNGSTHPGWIPLGRRSYMIFQERVTWEEAHAKCIGHDRASSLAVIVNLRDSQILGRYLLIGRPSLENAWTEAHYQNGHYVFQQENIVLSNVTNAEGYPPWRNGTIRKSDGCVLLDRHLANITYFVEARCERKRAYICYKRTTRQDLFTDILIDEFGYRLYYNRLPWDMARNKCNAYKKKYEAKLAEIRERRIVSHMLYVMGENRTAVLHIWLGGILDSIRNQWCWDSDKSLVDIAILDWLKNTTYLVNIEQYNTCLNMDRENHVKAMHYGTICDYEQNFVCMFPREKLIQLKKDEMNAIEMRRTKRRNLVRYG